MFKISNSQYIITVKMQGLFIFFTSLIDSFDQNKDVYESDSAESD